MSKCHFVYACGTGFIFNDLNGISVDLGGRIRWQGNLIYGTPGDAGVIPGINGRSAVWDLSTPSADPFPALLDPDVWKVQTINYPASFLGGTGLFNLSMGASINQGIDKMTAAIQALPPTDYFAIGGYSQGAAVASGCLLAGLQDGASGPLASHRSRFLGGVAFGNPRRQRDFLGDHGTWSGAWDIPGSPSGGGGAFPGTGPWRRLTDCDAERWLEFTAPDDIFSSVGTSTLGAGFTNAIEVFLDLTKSNIIDYFFSGLIGPALDGVNAAMGDGGVGTQVMYMVDGTGRNFKMAGGGHVTYPLMAPCDSDGTWTSSTTPITPGDGLTYLKSTQESCYQLALRWLEAKAAAIATAPIALPSTPQTTASAGWSSTLVPPSL